VLDQLIGLLAPFGADLRGLAVDRAINALLDTDQEVLARLDRIEAKLDALTNKDAAAGWQYLRQAQEPHRPPAEQRDQLRLALHAFTGAAAGAPDDALSRSAARVYQAVCWACLGSQQDVRLRLEEAATDAYDAVYQAAIRYNEPQRAAAQSGESWAARHRPGTAVVRKNLRRGRSGAGQSPTTLERFLASSPTRPALRLQRRMEPWLGEVNGWAAAVTELRDRMRDPGEPTGPAATECRVVSRESPGGLHKAIWGSPPDELAPRRADLELRLSRGTAIDADGIAIDFLDAVPGPAGDGELVDVLLRVRVSGYARRARAGSAEARPWCVSNQVAAPRDLDGLPSPPLAADTSRWFHGNGTRVGPGFADEVTGWRRFPRRPEPGAVQLTLIPAGPLFPVISPHDARPALSVRLTLG
jgi:hypothetical protein